MALDLTLLTTKAECDEVLSSLEAELDTYTHRDGNLDYADRQSGRINTDVAARLAGVNAEIAAYTAIAATPGLTPLMQKANASNLRRANDRKDNLSERGEKHTGSAAFLADVDADQIAAQVATLTAAQTAVTAHKATLPA